MRREQSDGMWLLTGVGHVATRRGHEVERKEREKRRCTDGELIWA